MPRLKSRLTVLLLLTLTGCAGSSAPSEPGTASTGGTDPGTAAANADAERIAVSLESYYRTAGYPRDLTGAIASLAGAGLAPSDGNAIAGYAYDEKKVEFRLCVQTTSGAWATYDTAPMTLRRGGPAGGCPKGI